MPGEGDTRARRDAEAAVQRAARDAYGRLVAWLASRTGDLVLAEDAVADALESALRRWPDQGVPQRPEAWLLTVARRKLIDRRRRSHTRESAVESLTRAATERVQLEATEAADAPFRDRLPDKRLELMFVCTHPDIDEAMRTPLILQTVLGLNAEQIGSCMLVAPSTMGQRLVRAKRRIVERGIAFALPAREAWPARMRHVLEAIYAAYGTGWDAHADLGDRQGGLALEAMWLTRLLIELCPAESEALGLYALMCFCESRRHARRTLDGAYVPLEEQDTGAWDQDLILEGEKALWIASKAPDAGPFQTEAAIHSVHAYRGRSGSTDWSRIEQLYRLLVRQSPSVGAQIGHAAALGRIGRAGTGLERLDELAPELCRRSQPYWAVRAWLLVKQGQFDEAHHAYARAIGLSADPAVRRWLADQQATTGRTHESDA